jgi:hypothetical protein
MKPMTILVAALLLPFGLRAELPPDQGTLLAYEPFDYSPAGSDLIGRNGGTGFSGGWTGSDLMTNFDMAPGSLPFGSLPVMGQHARSAAQITPTFLWRELANVMGAAGTTRYLSFLLRPEGVLNVGTGDGFFGLCLPGLPGGKLLFIGTGGETHNSVIERNYLLEDYGGSRKVKSNHAPVIGQTVLLVVKAEFTAGNDRFTLYVNPAAGGAEPTSRTVKSDLDLGTVSRFAICSGGEVAIDELRTGETFAAVTPRSGG